MKIGLTDTPPAFFSQVTAYRLVTNLHFVAASTVLTTIQSFLLFYSRHIKLKIICSFLTYSFFIYILIMLFKLLSWHIYISNLFLVSVSVIGYYILY